MGTVFQYIADAALEPSGLGACQHCDRSNVTSYAYHGEIVDASLAANPQLAREDPEIYAACADCIRGGNLRKSTYDLSQIQRVVDGFAHDKAAAIVRYNGIPQIPLMMQNEDWPMCCGDWCEFHGNPKDTLESVDVPRKSEYWEFGIGKWEFDFELEPESLREVCVFRCRMCDRSYFIWQPT